MHVWTHACMCACVWTKSEECVVFVAIVDIPQGADSGGDGGRTFLSTSKWPHSTQLSSEVRPGVCLRVWVPSIDLGVSMCVCVLMHKWHVCLVCLVCFAYVNMCMRGKDELLYLTLFMPSSKPGSSWEWTTNRIWALWASFSVGCVFVWKLFHVCIFLKSCTHSGEARESGESEKAAYVTVSDVLLVWASAAVKVKSTVYCFVSSFPAGENGNSQHRTDAVNTTHQKRAERDSHRRHRERVMEGGVGDS